MNCDLVDATEKTIKRTELAQALNGVGITLRTDFDGKNKEHILEVMSQLTPYRCDGGPLNERSVLTQILKLLSELAEVQLDP